MGFKVVVVVLLPFLLCVIANNSRFIVRKKREEMANTMSPQGDSLGNKALEETRKARLKDKQTNINKNIKKYNKKLTKN